jgi:GT2 family glycosyltransferase
MQSHNLTIIIVSWNVRELLLRCIASLHRSLAGSAITYEIVVIDNASHDGTPALLRATNPEVRLIESGNNLGFAGGNNLGLRFVLGQPHPPDYVFVLNPDTEAMAESVPQLMRWMHQHRDVAVAGPLLRYPDGSIQSSRRRFPTIGVYLFESTPLEWRFPNNPWARRYRMADTPDNVEQDVDWLVGAALLIRRSAIEQVGLFDARFSLYSEELEWQRRLCHAGRIVFVPSAEIMHYEGQSSAQIPTRRLILFHANRLRYIRMTHGATVARLIQWFLLAAYGIELLLESAKWLIGQKRELRTQRMQSYAALLRALVRHGAG